MNNLLETMIAQPRLTVMAVVLLAAIIIVICIALERRAVTRTGLDTTQPFVPSWVANGLYMPTIMALIITKSFPVFLLCALQSIVIGFAKHAELKKRAVPESVMRVFRITTPIQTIVILAIFAMMLWREYYF